VPSGRSGDDRKVRKSVAWETVKSEIVLIDAQRPAGYGWFQRRLRDWPWFLHAD